MSLGKDEAMCVVGQGWGLARQEKEEMEGKKAEKVDRAVLNC